MSKSKKVSKTKNASKVLKVLKTKRVLRGCVKDIKVTKLPKLKRSALRPSLCKLSVQLPLYLPTIPYIY
jgi:hypothetical protein